MGLLYDGAAVRVRVARAVTLNVILPQAVSVPTTRALDWTTSMQGPSVENRDFALAARYAISSVFRPAPIDQSTWPPRQLAGASLPSSPRHRHPELRRLHTGYRTVASRQHLSAPRGRVPRQKLQQQRRPLQNPQLLPPHPPPLLNQRLLPQHLPPPPNQRLLLPHPHQPPDQQPPHNEP
jgi:hypothetical protein